MSRDFKKNSHCRICGSSHLEEFLSLGEMPPANSFIKQKDLLKEKAYPLRVVFCSSCNLVQLRDIVDKEKLFSHYVYFFSAMPAASQHFNDYTQEVLKFIGNRKKDLIVEIGSNDGLLLKCFQRSGCKNVLGIDPAKNIARFANKQGVPTIDKFFSESLAKKISRKKGKAKIIIGNNVVAHIDNLQDLMRGVDELLDKDGVFVLEAPYLVDMFKNLAFDSIYHEHLSYLAITPLTFLFKRYGMEIFNTRTVERQGTSIRVYVGRKNQHWVSRNVSTFLKKEKALKLNKINTYRILTRKIEETKVKLSLLLRNLKKQGYQIAAYGAPARGNTLLNYCKIGTGILNFATEELPLKIGLLTPGTHVPVIHVKEARKHHPDYYLMLAWNYREQILKKEADFVKRGGKFILPVKGIKII